MRYLVQEQGIRQFLDVGTGLPTADNTHEVAQRVAPEARIVYVDNDPLVLAHARALLTSSPEGATSYIDADMHDPEAILAEAAETLDLDQPVALLMIGVLGHVADYDEARSIVRALLDGLPSGSYLVETDGTDSSPEYLAAIEMYRDSGGVPYNARTARADRRVLQGAGAGRARRGAHPPVAARAQRVRRGPRRLRVRRRRPQALIPRRTRRCSGRCAASTGRPAGARLV